MYLKRCRASVFALCTLSFISPTYAAQVQLGNTTVIGIQTTLNQEFFGGIPFAERPIGDLRFANPILKTSLEVETFNATQLGPACLQPQTEGPIEPPPMSEDCLTINIYRPAGIPSNASLPVMAWIYGGGFITGHTYTYNGSDIVSQSISRGTPIIYVNFNYRLGPLGFPQGSEAMTKGALNLGFKDQIKALEWIQHNIHAFGGDKSKVTLFGESAGSISTSAFLLDDTIAGSLFHGAILESGTASSQRLFNATRRQSVWNKFVQAVPACASLVPGDDAFNCLRNASSTEILNASAVAIAFSNEQLPWTPVIDGPGGFIPELPSKLYATGAFARIPFIAGSNLDEGTFFTPVTINSSETIREWIITNHTTTNSSSEIEALGEAADRLLDLYPDNPALGSPFNTGNETFGLSSQFKRLSAIFGDISMQSLRRLAIQAASNNSVKTFGYLFTEPPPAIAPAHLGVFHGSELLYIYPNILFGLVKPKEKLSSWMMDYWLSFATSLDPNDGKGRLRPQWKQYTPANQEVLQLNDQNTTMIPDDYRAKQIDYINAHSELFLH